MKVHCKQCLPPLQATSCHLPKGLCLFKTQVKSPFSDQLNASHSTFSELTYSNCATVRCTCVWGCRKSHSFFSVLCTYLFLPPFCYQESTSLFPVDPQLVPLCSPKHKEIISVLNCNVYLRESAQLDDFLGQNFIFTTQDFVDTSVHWQQMGFVYFPLVKQANFGFTGHSKGLQKDAGN